MTPWGLYTSKLEEQLATTQEFRSVKSGWGCIEHRRVLGAYKVISGPLHDTIHHIHSMNGTALLWMTMSLKVCLLTCVFRLLSWLSDTSPELKLPVMAALLTQPQSCTAYRQRRTGEETGGHLSEPVSCLPAGAF